MYFFLCNKAPPPTGVTLEQLRASPGAYWCRCAPAMPGHGARARFNDGLDPRVVVGEHGYWQACAELGLPACDPFGPTGSNVNLLIDTAARDPVSGTASHRSYLCEIRRAA